MELFIYKGEFGLPSIDFDCIRVFTYFKLADLPVKINYSASPWRSNNGFLPYLVDGGKLYSGYEKIVSHLEKEKGYSLITSAPQLSFLQENLYPFFLYTLFGNPQNQDETRRLYALRTPFPFNFYYPNRYIKKTDQLCQALANFSLEDPIDHQDTTEMNLKAKKCLNWISEKLDNNEFFLNGCQSEVDATLFAYLAIILKYQLPNNQLLAHAKQCENLTRYVDNITKKFFTADELFESPKAKAQSQKQDQKIFTGNEDEEPKDVVRRRYILSALFATSAMISYGFLSGIFSVTREASSDQSDYPFTDEIPGDDDE